MKSDMLAGGCLCGAVAFEIHNEFAQFHVCHCVQCQKTTGTVNASNLFTAPEHITWLRGQDLPVRYDLPGRRISNVFCPVCGSRLPWLSLAGDTLAVPAGCLDGTPNIVPRANIFWPERASWYEPGVQAPVFDGFMEEA